MNQCRNIKRANGAIPKRQNEKITYRRDKENTMDTLTKAPVQLKLAGAMLAMAALVITLLAVNFAAGPAQAQETTTPPKPCGPGANPVPDSPDLEIKGGHHAVFDAYWWPLEEGVDGSGTLNNNLCPPRVVHTKTTDPVTRKTTTTHHLYASNIDIGTTVFRVPDVAKRSLTDALLEKYPALKKDLTADDYEDGQLKTGADAPQVWWLQPDTPGQPIIGFSAYRFDDEHWHYKDEDGNEVTPLQYEFEAVREPGIPPAEYGHFFVFDDEDDIPADQTKVEAIWDSYDTDTNELKLEPGDVRHFQWVFTKPGYYVLEVHIKGHVRKENPLGKDDPDYDENWKRVSEDDTVTSEVKEYTFFVGDKTPNHPPRFAVERSVPENSASGTKVGDPIDVVQGDSDSLTFSLSGPGHSLFTVEATSDGNAQVKTGGDSHRHLDYEVKPVYDLVLGVSDCKTWQGKDEDTCTVDSTQALRVQVTNVKEPVGVTLSASQNPINVGETLFLYASVGDIPAGAGVTKVEGGFLWTEHPTQNTGIISGPTKAPVYSYRADNLGSSAERSYSVDVLYYDAPGVVDQRRSNTLTISWVKP